MQEDFISLSFGILFCGGFFCLGFVLFFSGDSTQLIYILYADCGSHCCFSGGEGNVFFASMNNGNF